MSKDIKIVDISFDPAKLQVSIDSEVVYGIKVKKDGNKLKGKCDERIKKSLLDGGRCDK